jgi:hypothetical protein
MRFRREPISLNRADVSRADGARRIREAFAAAHEAVEEPIGPQPIVPADGSKLARSAGHQARAERPEAVGGLMLVLPLLERFQQRTFIASDLVDIDRGMAIHRRKSRAIDLRIANPSDS